jgi:hypothetical protein
MMHGPMNLKPEGRDSVEGLGMVGRIILKCGLRQNTQNRKRKIKIKKTNMKNLIEHKSSN